MNVRLPTDLVLYTLQYADGPTLCRCNQVCKGWRKRIENTPDLWKYIYLRENGGYYPPSIQEGWKTLYKRQFVLKRSLTLNQPTNLKINSKLSASCLFHKNKVYLTDQVSQKEHVLRVYNLATGKLIKGCILDKDELPILQEEYEEKPTYIFKDDLYKIKPLSNDHFFISDNWHHSIWNANTDACLFRVLHIGSPIAFNGKYAVYSKSTLLVVWDVAENKLLHNIDISAHPKKIEIINNFLCLIMFQENLIVYDITTGTKLYDKMITNKDVEFGETFFSLSSAVASQAEIYNSATGVLIHTIPMQIFREDNKLICHSHLRDHYFYCICPSKHKVVRWNLQTGLSEYLFEISTTHIKKVFYSLNRLVIYSFQPGEFHLLSF